MLGAAQDEQSARSAIMAAGPTDEPMGGQHLVGMADPNAMYYSAANDQFVGAEGPVSRVNEIDFELLNVF